MKFTVLHIEDEMITRELMRCYLEQFNIEFITAASKEEFRLLDVTPNLIICDGHIADWDGHFEEVAKKFGCDIMVVYSGFDQDVLDGFRKKGFNNVFQKNPMDTRRLIYYIVDRMA